LKKAKKAKRLVVVLGKPGAGKDGLINEFVKMGYSCGHISPGQCGRDEKSKGSDLGMRMDAYQDAGILAPLELVEELIGPRVKMHKDKEVLFLDGFPRNMEQLPLLFKFEEEFGYDELHVWDVETSDRECVRRLVAAKRGRSDDGCPRKASYRIKEVFKNETLPVINFFEHGDGRHKVHFVRLSGEDMRAEASQYVRDFAHLWKLHCPFHHLI